MMASMANVQAGRRSAEIEGDFVVFLIGMRVNQPWKLRQWVPVARAMQRMQVMLAERPELGCLGVENWFGRTTISLQYWRSFEHLDRFAQDQDLPHLDAWRDFNRRVRDSGDVGIWHETYQVRSGAYEAIYGNMPDFGLAAAGGAATMQHRGQSAAFRIGAAASDEPVVEGY